MNQAEFEETLKKGDKVRVRWHKGTGPAVIERVNHISFTVRLLDQISGEPAGSTIRVSRVSSGRWSAANCVRPLEK
jgi:hypothetical protein